MNKLKEYYCDLHQIPELGFKEFKTQKYILEKLSRLKCHIHTTNPTGIIAYFDFKKTKTYAFRAEMDGLPIQEKNTFPYASKNGNMHACGHDAHMSILLKLCEYINEHEPNINIIAIFQPSEECYGGALKIIQDQYFNSLNIDEIFGLHIFPKLPSAKIFTCKKLMASATEIDIEIKGYKTHITESGIDAIKTACKLLKSIKTKRKEIFNCGTFHAYGKRNVICDNARLECTYRTFKNLGNFQRKVKKKITKIESKTGTKINVNFRTIPLLQNKSKMLSKSIKILKKGFYQAEDFAFYSSKYNTLYVLLGCGNTQPLHSDTFNFDLNLLEVGYNYYLDIIYGLDKPKLER